MIEALNTLDSRCRVKDYPSKNDVKNLIDCILIAYPFIGKELYNTANEVVKIIEKYADLPDDRDKNYSAEDGETITKLLAEYLNKYNANVNSKESI